MRFFFFGIILLTLSTCLSEPDCTVTASNIVKIALKKVNSDSVKFVRFTSITVSGTDNTFQNLKDSVSSLALPVNPLTSQTTFRFKYKSVVNSVTTIKSDSVTLTYVTKSVIISPSCGGYLYYSGIAVSATSFITVPKVVNSQLSTSAATNLEIKL